MTKLLDQAIAKIRERPEAGQDDAAEILFVLAAKAEESEALETRATIQEGLEQAERGELDSDEEMAEFFRRRGA